MTNADVLKLLFPLELTGVFDDDIALEGQQLDNAQSNADQLLLEMLPQSASSTVSYWERVCGIIPASTDTLQIRQANVLTQLRARGGLSLPYFMAIAASMGYVITIQELLANSGGYGSEGIFRWTVTVSGTPVYYFRVGQSGAGDSLISGNVATALEGIFTDLKPAHTQVIFAYN